MQVAHDSIVRVLDRALADSAFPGAISVVGTRGGGLTSYAVGRIDWPATAPSPDERTLWDLASLTKVVGMTTAMMQLVEQDRVELDAPVMRYLPEFAGEGKERVTIRHLLTHSSGLPSWRPLYKEATAADTAVAIVFATPLDTVPGARMVYSDLGAILLGKVVERVSGETLDAHLARHVFGPLGMTSTLYRPDASLRDRIAPTEFDPWRQRHIRGEVHDENAFMLGGVSGHAGLFSTAADLARFARMMLSGGTLDGVRVLRASTIAQFTAVQDPGLSHRALGWETPSGQNSAGRRMSARAFGHTGFTGTSLWMDPEAGTFVILLTNRVNPSRQNTRIGQVRVALADAVMAALGSAAPLSPGSP
jgi:CubicO group peptidase (beta-lactamase class C family)